MASSVGSSPKDSISRSSGTQSKSRSSGGLNQGMRSREQVQRGTSNKTTAGIQTLGAKDQIQRSSGTGALDHVSQRLHQPKDMVSIDSKPADFADGGSSVDSLLGGLADNFADPREDQKTGQKEKDYSEVFADLGSNVGKAISQGASEVLDATAKVGEIPATAGNWVSELVDKVGDWWSGSPEMAAPRIPNDPRLDISPGGLPPASGNQNPPIDPRLEIPPGALPAAPENWSWPIGVQ